MRLQAEQLPLKAGWWETSLVLWNLADAIEHTNIKKKEKREKKVEQKQCSNNSGD